MANDTPSRLDVLQQRLAQVDACIGQMYDLRRVVLDEFQAEQISAGSYRKPDGFERRLSRLGDSRERAVLCRVPGCLTQTIAYYATCDSHHHALWRSVRRDGVDRG